MNIQLNGQEQQVKATTVAELLLELGLEGRMIAIERNREVVSRSQYEQLLLQANDRIEIVHMIGGG